MPSVLSTASSIASRPCCARKRVRCSKQRVARLMREMELAAKRRRNIPVGTARTRGAPVAPNLPESGV